MSRVTTEQIHQAAKCHHDWHVQGMRRQCTKCHMGERIMDMQTTGENLPYLSPPADTLRDVADEFERLQGKYQTLVRAINDALGGEACICEYSRRQGVKDHSLQCQLLRSAVGIPHPKAKYTYPGKDVLDSRTAQQVYNDEVYSRSPVRKP